MSRQTNAIHSPATLRAVMLAGVASLVLAAGCGQKTPARPKADANKLYVAGALALQQGDRAAAEASLNSAITENPDLIMARFLLGNIAKDEGNFEEAAIHYERVVELDPYVYHHHYRLGLVNHLMNKLQKAQINYHNALKLKHDDVKSNMNLGLVYTALGKP